MTLSMARLTKSWRRVVGMITETVGEFDMLEQDTFAEIAVKFRMNLLYNFIMVAGEDRP